MKIKNYVEIREKRERLIIETWTRIEKIILGMPKHAPIELVKRWYDLENSRYRRPEYEVQFRRLYYKIIKKHDLYFQNRKKFDKEHEELLVELEIDKDLIIAANEADAENEAIFIKNRDKKNQLKIEFENLKPLIAEHKSKIDMLKRDIQYKSDKAKLEKLEPKQKIENDTAIRELKAELSKERYLYSEKKQIYDDLLFDIKY